MDYQLNTEKEYFCLLQSTLDISKSKFISDNLYFKVTFLILDNLRYQQFEIQGVEIKLRNVSRVYPLIHDGILRYQCSTYEKLVVAPALFWRNFL